MRFSFRPTVRRLAAAAALPALALGLSLGSTPQAAAEATGSGSIDIQFVVHKNDTVDVTYSSDIGGVDPNLYCKKEFVTTGPNAVPDATVDVVGNSCVVKAKAVPLEKMNKGQTTLKHEGKKFIYREPTGPTAGNPNKNVDFKVQVSMTFPGKVYKADGGGVIKGNKVTWTNPPEDGFGAEASDGSFNVLLWVLLGLLALAVVAAVVVFLVVASKRKKNASPAGTYPQQGAQFQAQPGYGAGQPLTGTPYAQPQTYQQPGTAQQPPVAGQAYQQPGTAQQPPAAGQPYQQPGYGQPQGGQTPGSNGYGY